MSNRIACETGNHRLISLQSTCLIAQCFTERGLPVEPLLNGTGLSINDLAHPIRLITPDQEQRVFANAARLSNLAATALQLGQRMRISAYGQLGYAMLSSATLGQAIRVMLSHPNMLGSYFRLSSESLSESTVSLRASKYLHSPELYLFNLELCFSSIKAVLDDALGQPLPLSGVYLQEPIQGHTDRFPEFFGDCPVLAGQPVSEMTFDAGWLAAPLPLADPVTHRDALEQCQLIEARFTRASSSLAVEVVTRIRHSLDAPPTLEQLADHFHCTPRTLRRHLNQTGRGYQKILDDLRYQRAQALLAEPELPISRIAEQLGFSETASFRHAFLRWSGLSPRSWRQTRQLTAAYSP